MSLNDRTTLPIVWVFIAIPFIVGSLFWLSFIAYSVDAHAARVTGLETKMERKEEILIQIREDVAVIKQRLESQQRR
jgi:hypothetical protein